MKSRDAESAVTIYSNAYNDCFVELVISTMDDFHMSKALLNNTHGWKERRPRGFERMT